MKSNIKVSNDISAFWFVTFDYKIYLGDITMMYLVIGTDEEVLKCN